MQSPYQTPTSRVATSIDEAPTARNFWLWSVAVFHALWGLLISFWFALSFFLWALYVIIALRVPIEETSAFGTVWNDIYTCLVAATIYLCVLRAKNELRGVLTAANSSS